MRIIKASVEIFDIEDEMINWEAARKSEFCGRVCYNSISRIVEGSATKFVLEKADMGHGSILEHGPIYLKRINASISPDKADEIRRVLDSVYTVIGYGDVDIYTNLRVVQKEAPNLFRAILQRDSIEAWGIEFVRVPDNDPNRLVTVKYIIDRGVSHETVRNRGDWPGNSFSQESTRYCNFSKEKEGSEITVIEPCFWDSESEEYKIWRDCCEYVEKGYMKLISLGATPQEARSVLPNSLKTILMMTSSLIGWHDFLRLRTPVAAHPQMREVSIPQLEMFNEAFPGRFDDIDPETL